MKNKIKEIEVETPRKKKKEKPRKKSGVSKFFSALLNGDFLTRDGFVNQFPFILYLTVLFISYIALGYYYENTLREIEKTKVELDHTKNIYHTTIHELKETKRKSTVKRQLEDLGFTNHVSQPRIIEKKPATSEK